jgi:TolA-binding protein
MGTCIICGKESYFHHNYCDDHYPQKLATITQLKKQLKEANEKIRRLEQSNTQMRSLPKSQRNKYKQLLVQYRELKVSMNGMDTKQ